jgi:hypothetical protein
VLASYETLLHGARRLTVPAPSARLAERAVEQFSAAGAVSPARPARFQATHWAALATAAAVVLVVVGLAGRQLRRSGQTDDAVAQPASGSNGGNAATPANRRAVAALNPGGRPRRQPAKPTELVGAQQPSVAAVAPVGGQPEHASPDLADYRTTISLWAQQWPVAVDKIDAFEQYAPGIRPIRASFSAALDALRRTLPGSSEANSAVPQARGEMGEMSVA